MMSSPIQFSGGVSLPHTPAKVRQALIRRLAKEGVVAEDVWMPAGEWRKEGKGHLLSNADLAAYQTQKAVYEAAKGTENEAAELEKLGKMLPNPGFNRPYQSVRQMKVFGDYGIIKSYLSK